MVFDFGIRWLAILLGAMFIGVALNACAGTSPEPTSTQAPEPTATSTTTATSSPTLEPAPTATLAPTATPPPGSSKLDSHCRFPPLSSSRRSQRRDGPYGFSDGAMRLQL